MATQALEAADPPPRKIELPNRVIWVLLGSRVGDNAQANALASLLNARVVCKQLRFNSLQHLPSQLLGASTMTLASGARDELAPPWPDMVIAIGRRSAPVARWIKTQSKGKSKTVHLGRPRTSLSAFDLVISTPQYGLPPAANVVQIPLPFVGRRAVEAAGKADWLTAWAGLRRPVIAAVIGHSRYPLKLGRREARTLGRRLNALAEDTHGSLLLIPSPRSVPEIISRIEMELSAPHIAYRHFDPQKNPYPAALDECDYFVATSDSISVISELIATQKPVDVFELPERILTLKWCARAGLGAWLSRRGILQAPRDVSGMVKTLIENGYLGVLGDRQGRVAIEPGNESVLERLSLLLSV